MMTEKEKIVCETLISLEEHGITIADLMNTSLGYKTKLLQLGEEEQFQFSNLYEKIINKDYVKAQKGKLLEDLANILLFSGNTKLFGSYMNLRTSTNEIDILVTWTEAARLSHINCAYNCFDDLFLCECKNYKGKVSVTYVGKFYSLLKVTNCKFGIMFCLEGVSGRGPWHAAKGLIKKIALKDETYIIVIEKSDLKLIYEQKRTFLSIVHDKYLELKADIDFSKDINKHECENAFISKNNEQHNIKSAKD